MHTLDLVLRFYNIGVFFSCSQYALLLNSFQYCRSILDPDVPASILLFMFREEQDGDDDLSLRKVPISLSIL